MSAATIIFFDIAGYSKKSTAQQRELRRSLTEWVRSELRALPSPAAENVIKHPAGDGMLLAFLHQEENPWRNDVLLDFIVGLHQWACAETARGCNDDVRVRMGVHVGQIDIDVDVNGTRSVVGTTVNDTQRIMDAANPRQTLFSEAFIREYFGLQLRLDFQ